MAHWPLAIGYLAILTMKIRVLEVSNELHLGGAEKTLQLFVKYLDRERFEVFVCGALKGGDRVAAIESYRVPVYVKPDLPELMRQLRPDIVHVHRAGWPEPYVIEAAKSVAVPVVVETNVFGRVDDSPFGQQIDCHLFVSYFCARRYQGWVGHPLTSDKFEVLYNPIDLDEFEAHDFTRDFSRSSVGRISRADNMKWHNLCLDIVPYVLQHIPNLEYHVIGDTPEIRERVRFLKIENTFQFHPPTTAEAQILNFYKSITVYVHGSQIGETFGCGIAEAMASGIPVVTHNSYGNADNAQVELVDHGVTGFVADDPKSYAGAVITLLTNPDIARQMGERGREKVRMNYEAKRITKGLEEVFLRLYEKKVAPRRE